MPTGPTEGATRVHRSTKPCIACKTLIHHKGIRTDFRPGRPVGRYGGSPRASNDRPQLSNGGCSAYRASEADKHAWRRALRPKPCRLARHAELRWRVAQKLVLQWSPEQISGWLKRQFPAAPGMQVSHETI